MDLKLKFESDRCCTRWPEHEQQLHPGHPHRCFRGRRLFPNAGRLRTSQDARRSDNAASLVMFQIGTSAARLRPQAALPRCTGEALGSCGGSQKRLGTTRRCDAWRPEPGRADRSAIKTDNCRRSVAAALAGSGRGVASDEVKRAPAARGQRRTAARKPFPRPGSALTGPSARWFPSHGGSWLEEQHAPS
jgi:hypothetical protein